MTARLVRNASGARHFRWGREILATLAAHAAHNDLLSAPQKTAIADEQRRLEERLASLGGSVTAYRGWLDGAHVSNRAELRVANYLADEAQRATDGTLRPHSTHIANMLPGGYPRIFSGLSMSRVLRAGHARTAQLVRETASVLRSLPNVLSGVGALPDVAPLVARLDVTAQRIETLLDVQLKEIEPQRRPLKLAVERSVLELRESLEQMDARLRSHFPTAFIESLYPELAKGNRAVADEPDEDDDDSEDPESPQPQG